MNEYVSAVIFLLAGLGAFLVGFRILSESVAKLANQKLKQLLNKVTNNKLLGVGIGTVITCIIQSSSVTTVMVVGFVNAGVMNLFQATTIIMGANIGTTITAQIVALQAFKITTYAMLLTAIGIFGEIFAKREKTKTIFYSVAGLGLVFVGLAIMGDSMSIFKTSSAIAAALTSLNNPFLLLLVGLVVTGIIQSSSAVTTILISMVGAGLVIGQGSSNAVLYVILGTNIGTCVTALLSSIGASPNGKRAALIHLMFNIFGAVIVGTILLFWPHFTADTLMLWFPHPGTQIAMFHTFFNVFCTIIFLPFTAVFVKLSHFFVRDKETSEPVSFFDERLLKTPAFAIAQLTKELGRLGTLAMDSLERSIRAFNDQDVLVTNEIKHSILAIEELDREITGYLIRVSAADLAIDDEKMVSRLHHALGDYIRIAEISDNIIKYTRTSVDKRLEFSPAVRTDLDAMYQLLQTEFNLTNDLFVNRNMALLPEIENIEEQVDVKRNQMIDDHVKRLNEGTCSPNNSAVYINFVSNLERVGDHINYVAHSYEEQSVEERELTEG